MKFIWLRQQGAPHQDILVNMDRVQHVSRVEGCEPHTRVWFSPAEMIRVQESPETIEKLLDPAACWAIFLNDSDTPCQGESFFHRRSEAEERRDELIAKSETEQEMKVWATARIETTSLRS